MRSNLGITASGELIGAVDSTTGETWRFSVNEHDGTVYRGRKYRLPEDDDRWSWYWESDQMAAFYDEGFRGLRVVDGTDPDDGARAVAAFKAERDGEKGSEGALDRLAKRMYPGSDEAPSTARFIRVPLDRGMDLYALSYDGDPEGEWRDEIQAAWHGDVWRIETEEYQPGMGPGGTDWINADDICEEWYGEDNADEGWKKEFPLPEFPAELFTDGSL